MKPHVLAVASLLVFAITAPAAANCYGWYQASDFGRAEADNECFVCQYNGIAPDSAREGAAYCVAQMERGDGSIVYMANNTLFDDFRVVANSVCGCGPFELD